MPYFQQGLTEAERTIDGMTEALMCRTGEVYDDEGRPDHRKRDRIRAENEYSSLTLSEMARELCTRQGIPKSMPLARAVMEAFDPRWRAPRSMTRAGGMTDADLPALVENLQTKAMQAPLSAEDESWRLWTRQTELRDFKRTSRVNLGSASGLKEIASGAGVERGYISDYAEYLKAATFGVELVVEYQTIVNDDTQALTRIPREIRRKASKRVGDLVYGILTENPTLAADNTALFHADHNNLVTAGGIPSIDTISAARAAMGTQRFPSPTGDDTNDPGDFVNVGPAYLIVPHKLQARAATLLSSLYDPDAPAGSQTANIIRAYNLTAVADARLDAFNPDGWFLAANPDLVATIEVGFVGSDRIEDAIMVKERTDWQTRGVSYAVWLDCDAAPMDYRGLYYNDGAA